jgi:CheY-like chemotaxis protein
MQILCAEDDPDDRALVRDALGRCGLARGLRFVKDGEELLEYLSLGNPVAAPRPDLILLDLWMPRKDGREALRELKANALLRAIPVVVVTTSRAEEDVFRSYDLGATSFVRKSAKFEDFVHVIQTVAKYWAEVAELPGVAKPAPPRVRRVLLLEGEPVSCPGTLTLPLGSLAFVTVAHPAGAVEAVRSDPSIEAVAIDLGVPGALDALAEIRGLRPGLPIVALSADVFDAGHALRAGAMAFVPRPCERALLEQTFGVILRKRA